MMQSKRDTIKVVAMRLFAQRGMDAVSVRDIAAACDMKAPNLYAHFPSKDAMISELFQEGYAEYGVAMADAVGEGAFRERLERVVSRICHLHDTDGDRFRFLLLAQHGALRDVTLDRSNPMEIISQTVAQAMLDGEIPVRDPALVAAGIVGVVLQAATFVAYGRLQGGLSARSGDLAGMCVRVAS